MNELEVRKASEDELTEVLALLSLSTPTTPENALDVFRKMGSYPDYGAYLCWTACLAVGTFTLLILDNLGHHCAPIAVVENVVVDKCHRGQGIGRAMMDNAVRRARERGCYKMILVSNRKLKAAHRFYKALGLRWQDYTLSLEL